MEHTKNVDVPIRLNQIGYAEMAVKEEFGRGGRIGIRIGSQLRDAASVIASFEKYPRLCERQLRDCLPAM
jgi:hypothetical protein